MEILKARLVSKQASEIPSAAKGNTEQNQVGNVITARQNTMTPSACVGHKNFADQGSAGEANVSRNVSTCIDVANVEMSHEISLRECFFNKII